MGDGKILNKLFVWDKSFPCIIRHTSIAFLKNCAGFNEAKNGDIQSAYNVVNICCKHRLIAEIRKKFPKAILLPINGTNKLPLILAKTIGLKVNTNISITNQSSRKLMTGIERLLHEPEFTGEIEAGREYILVDDVVAQGGTISALRKYVLRHRAIVCAVVALAHSANGGWLTPTDKSINSLNSKLDTESIYKILKSCISSNIEELTDMQIKYLLRFKSAEKLCQKINSHIIKKGLQSALP